MTRVDLPYTIDFCVGKIVGMTIYVSGDMVLAQKFSKTVAVSRVFIEIIAFVAMSAVVNIRKRNEWFMPEYENERFPGILKIIPDPFV